MKHLAASFLLCFCLITQPLAANRFNQNDWRSMPFIEMMVAMMKIMNQMVGGRNSFSNLNALPYSPALIPGMSSLGGLGGLPMSPAGLAAFPMANNTISPYMNNFQAGQNATGFNQQGGNFWGLDNRSLANHIPEKANASMNGIWQALSGDVIAIYNDNYFIWSDGNKRNLAGRMIIKGNQLIAYFPASKTSLQFQFYKEPGQFVVRDQKSRIYTFKRLH